MRRKGFPLLLLLFVSLCAPPRIQAEGKDGIPESVKAEIEQLRRERDTLEARIRSLEAQIEEMRVAVINAKMQLDLADLRCKQYREELKLVRAEKSIEKLASGENRKDDAPIRLIPPFVKKPVPAKSTVAQGKVTAIGTNGSLLQLSVGSESGVEAGQVLDVYRLGSTNGKQRILPVYLGTVTLQRVNSQESLGRYKGVPGLERRIKVGDEVASELIINGK